MVPGEQKLRGRAALSHGVNPRDDFLTNPDGTPVSAARAAEIRLYQYEYYVAHADQHGVEAIPRRWSKGKNAASTPFKVGYYAYMAARAPEGTFCHGGATHSWQFEVIAHGGFSQWRSNYLANLDETHYTRPDLVEDIKKAQAQRSKKTASRQVKRRAQKMASLGMSLSLLR